MSLMRAFTTRRNKPNTSLDTFFTLGRAASQRAGGGKPILRAQISSPVALISTSNVMLKNAHEGLSSIEYCDLSSSASSSSEEDSDASNGSIHSNETLTDASSVDDESPIRSEPETNHLSCYFKPAVDTTQTHIHPLLRRSASTASTSASSSSFDAPILPSRVPSHSKKAHESVHRRRSIQRMMAPPPSRASSRPLSFDVTSSGMLFVEAARKENPFGNELAQLDEVAEEFGQVVNDSQTAEDCAIMQIYDLALFSAADYLSDIHGLVAGTFDDDGMSCDSPGWI